MVLSRQALRPGFIPGGIATRSAKLGMFLPPHRMSQIDRSKNALAQMPTSMRWFTHGELISPKTRIWIGFLERAHRFTTGVVKAKFREAALPAEERGGAGRSVSKLC